MTALEQHPTGAALFKPKRAVLYLRVSTPGQVQTDYDPEGISLPTQRVKGQEKALALGAQIVEEFIEPGYTATTTDGRKAFHRMMAFIRAEGNIDYVITYARSRLFRNSTDAAIAKRDLKKHGAVIVSILDYTEDTPVGDLVATILDAVNEYQSRAMGEDIALKMEGKVRNGGMIAQAPIGYLNVREKFEGREVRTVAVDPERSPFVVMAFELYATGTYSYDQLLDTLTDAGLRTKPTRKYPNGHPISKHKLGLMLADRSYLGKVRIHGKEFDGRHEPIISRELFDRVQEVRDLQRGGGTRARVHTHYLKGSLLCQRCKGRFYYVPGHSHTGEVYFYFMCAGRHHGTCDLPYLNVAAVERAIEDNYATVTLAADLITRINAAMRAAIAHNGETDSALRAQLTRQLAELEAKEDGYLDLVGNPQWPVEKLTVKMTAVRDEKARVQAQLTKLAVPNLDAGRATISALLDLLSDTQRLYRAASEAGRKALNQAFFTRLYLDTTDDGGPVVTSDETADVIRPLVDAQRNFDTLAQQLDGGASLTEDTAVTVTPSRLLVSALANEGSNKRNMVAPTGFEPALLP